ncbi:hypothetical protein SAMN05443270_3465 [Lacrimispora sphenoides]|nr:hypothetical protein [Lacrimispora sphenoides]SEU22291.1 hypothetical protein SAMN05443270_3465 [Lacrimispora sphenoides]
MEMVMIMLVIAVFVLFGFFFGCVLSVNPEQKESEDNEQMEWIREYQEY